MFFQYVQNDQVVYEGNCVLNEIIRWYPFLGHYQRYFVHTKEFGPGHLSRIGDICVDFLMKDNVKRHIHPEEFIDLDEELAVFFDTNQGKH